MSASRLSLVMGGSTPAPDGDGLTLPLPETGTVHLHLHIGEAERPADKVVRYSVSGWTSLIFGVAVVAAMVGGYQLGHRPASDDISNLRPMPALGGFPVPELTAPSPVGGLPAIQRQLATPPQIIPPARASQQPGAAATTPGPNVPGAPAPGRNAFGLEN